MTFELEDIAIQDILILNPKPPIHSLILKPPLLSLNHKPPLHSLNHKTPLHSLNHKTPPLILIAISILLTRIHSLPFPKLTIIRYHLLLQTRPIM
jgi:hypothetical protein